MNKFIIALTVAFIGIAMTGCTERTQVHFECMKGVLHYDYHKTYVETGTTIQRATGVTTYDDGTVITCTKVNQ